MAGWSHNARSWIIDAFIASGGRPLYSIEILDIIREMRKGKRNNLSIRQIGSLCAAMDEVYKLKQEPQGCVWALKYRRVYNNKNNTKEHESEEE